MATPLSLLTPSAAQLHITITKDTRIVSFLKSFSRKNRRALLHQTVKKRGQRQIKGEVKWGKTCTEKNSLTIEAGEVSPVEQGAVEGGQGDVEEQIGAVGRVSDGVREQVHLQQGLEQIAQHLAAQRGTCTPLLYFTVTHSVSVSVLLWVGVCPLINLLRLLAWC